MKNDDILAQVKIFVGFIRDSWGILPYKQNIFGIFGGAVKAVKGFSILRVGAWTGKNCVVNG